MNVRFVMIGGWAFNFYATPRATGDFDFFVDPSPENQKKLHSVLNRFGFGAALPPEADKLFGDRKIIMLGRQPNRIDLFCEIAGVTFSEVWDSRVAGKLDGIELFFISREALIKNKMASGRTKDLADVEALRRTSS